MQYLHLGIQLGITVVLFTLGGHWLDGKYGTSPLWIIVGAFLGIGIGLYHFIRATLRTEHPGPNARPHESTDPPDRD